MKQIFAVGLALLTLGPISAPAFAGKAVNQSKVGNNPTENNLNDLYNNTKTGTPLDGNPTVNVSDAKRDHDKAPTTGKHEENSDLKTAAPPALGDPVEKPASTDTGYKWKDGIKWGFQNVGMALAVGGFFIAMGSGVGIGPALLIGAACGGGGTVLGTFLNWLFS